MPQNTEHAQPMPAQLTIYCDDCGRTDTRDYLVSSADSAETKFGYARALLNRIGWRCDDGGDTCPRCLADEADPNRDPELVKTFFGCDWCGDLHVDESRLEPSHTTDQHREAVWQQLLLMGWTAGRIGLIFCPRCSAPATTP